MKRQTFSIDAQTSKRGYHRPVVRLVALTPTHILESSYNGTQTESYGSGGSLDSNYNSGVKMDTSLDFGTVIDLEETLTLEP